MRKLFWENPYQSQLVTTVVSVEGNQLLFKETIAFSFSGGQESDKATINGLPVTHSENKGTFIYYELPQEHGLLPGNKVLMEIDWQRRYRLMRLHFAAELVLELVTRKFSVEKIGAHIAEAKARIDFLYDQSLSSFLDDVLGDYNEIIEKDIMIKTGFSDPSTQRRYWQIEGFAKVPCGGTHVKSTSEVGYIRLKRINIGASKERIEIRLVNDC